MLDREGEVRWWLGLVEMTQVEANNNNGPEKKMKIILTNSRCKTEHLRLESFEEVPD
jgi:hypothetical protein